MVSRLLLPVSEFYKIPKSVIRENANLIVLFRQDMRNLRQLHEAYVAWTLSFKEFVSFIEHCWNNSEYSFAVLDLTSATRADVTDVV